MNALIYAFIVAVVDLIVGLLPGAQTGILHFIFIGIKAAAQAILGGDK